MQSQIQTAGPMILNRERASVVLSLPDFINSSMGLSAPYTQTNLSNALFYYITSAELYKTSLKIKTFSYED